MAIGPRLFGIPATEAPIVAVIRRGPSAWSHVGLWDVDAGRFESGSWLRGHIYPQRCDISPDGRWLSYFALVPSGDWSAGATYIAISAAMGARSRRLGHRRHLDTGRAVHR